MDEEALLLYLQGAVDTLSVLMLEGDEHAEEKLGRLMEKKSDIEALTARERIEEWI